MKKLSDFFQKVINTYKCPLKDINLSYICPLIKSDFP